MQSGPHIPSIFGTMTVMATLSCATLYHLWHQGRAHYRGFGLFFHQTVCQALGVALVLGRGRLPDVVSIVLAHALVFGGVMLGMLGARRFLGLKERWDREALVFALFVLSDVYFWAIDPHLPARVALTFGAIAYFSSGQAWAFLKRSGDRYYATKVSGIVAGMIAMAAAARAGLNVTYDPFMTFEQTPLIDIVLTLMIQVLTLFFSFSLVTMVNAIGMRDLMDRETALREERDQLRRALDENNALRKLLPVCAWCQKIRDDKGYWSELKQYFVDTHRVTHGICPECEARMRAENAAYHRQ